VETKHLNLRGTVASRSEASSHLTGAGDAVLIERGRPRSLLILCPCGCGEEFPINLDARSGKAWRLYRNARTGLSVFPSVWRDSGCRSHYIIWRNKIYLFSSDSDGLDEPDNNGAWQQLIAAVTKQLPNDRVISYLEIADSLDAIPWDVLIVCRQLVRDKVAREGRGPLSGHFSLIG
jgi:hypothetical protein